MFKCCHCGIDFPLDWRKEKGRRTHTPIPPFCSKECSKHQRRNFEVCNKCGRNISLPNITKHNKVCNGIQKRHVQESWKIGDNKYKCPHCPKISNITGISAHIWRTHEDGQNFKPLLGKPAWNKGLTKETDERVRKNGETLSLNCILGITKPKGHTWTKESRSKLSVSKSKLLEELGNGGFRDVKWYKIKNILDEEYIVRGTWELKVATKLNDLGVVWKRRVYLQYMRNDGVIRTYTPDFYLPKYDRYIEVKGYFSKEDRQKIHLVRKQNNVTIVILKSKHIKNINNLRLGILIGREPVSYAGSAGS